MIRFINIVVWGLAFSWGGGFIADQIFDLLPSEFKIENLGTVILFSQVSVIGGFIVGISLGLVGVLPGTKPEFSSESLKGRDTNSSFEQNSECNTRTVEFSEERTYTVSQRLLAVVLFFVPAIWVTFSPDISPNIKKDGEIGGRSRMVRGFQTIQPTISPCSRVPKTNLIFKRISNGVSWPISTAGNKPVTGGSCCFESSSNPVAGQSYPGCRGVLRTEGTLKLWNTRWSPC